MSLSNAALTPGNLELSPCQVLLNTVDLGGTLKNVIVATEFSKAPMHMDQMGDTVINQKVSGLKVTVTMELAETKNKANWKAVFPHMKVVTSGGNKQVYVQSMIGDDDLSLAAVLQLHPLSNAAADLTGDFKFFLAVADAKSSTVFGPKDQQTLKVVFNILPDFTTTPARFYVHGDPSIGLVASSNAAAVAGGGNTGLDTVGTISTFSGYTKTETITLTCVTPGAAGQFFVSGSVSGALGLATVGTQFTSAVISLLITDNSTHATLGDTYTIATTAANYA